MSAIWGAVSIGGKPLVENIAKVLRKPFEKCAIDRFEEYQAEGLCLGCGIQYFTKEAEHEKLPLRNESCRTFFTADIMLDNRKELAEKLGISEQTLETMADGDLAFAFLERYGMNGLNDMLGAYAFAYYDKNKGAVELVSDATGNRCLYYHFADGILYFSTLMEPIFTIMGKKEINERWATDYLAMDNMAPMTEFHETLYMGIYKVEPRERVTVTKDGYTREKYWQPDSTPLILENDEAYANQLKEILRQSIACLLRDNKMCLMLSGGLDSTAVACYALPLLLERNMPLYTFTSVPESDYKSKDTPYRLENEGESARMTCDFLRDKGLDVTNEQLPMEGLNMWDTRWEVFGRIEIPYKSMQNKIWIYESLRRSREIGSRILLEGQYGNVTISRGDVDLYLYDLLRHWRFIKFARELNAFGKGALYGRKRRLKTAVKMLRSYLFSPQPDTSDKALFNHSLVNKTALDVFETRQRFSERDFEEAKRKTNYADEQKCLVADIVFSIKGEIYTKNSLYSGCILRDPTMDKRLIDFCCRLPAGHTVRDGVQRRLTRVYLRDELPPHIQREMRFGAQGADLSRRLNKHWDRIFSEIHDVFCRNAGSQILDSHAAIETLEACIGGVDNLKEFDATRICYTAHLLEITER